MRVVQVAVFTGAVAGVVLAAGCGGRGGGADTTTATTTTSKPKTTFVVSAIMTGAAAEPKGPPGASGTATITLRMRTEKACWRFAVRGIDKPLSAHVHAGRRGELGEVVIPLGDRFSRTGCVLTGKRALRLVGRAPSAYYVHVHTPK